MSFIKKIISIKKATPNNTFIMYIESIYNKNYRINIYNKDDLQLSIILQRTNTLFKVKLINNTKKSLLIIK